MSQKIMLRGKRQCLFRPPSVSICCELYVTRINPQHNPAIIKDKHVHSSGQNRGPLGSTQPIAHRGQYKLT